MSREPVDVLKQIFAELFGVPESRFHRGLLHGDVVKWDSIAHMGMAARLEDTWQIEFDVDDIMEMQSVEAILTVLRRCGVAGA